MENNSKNFLGIKQVTKQTYNNTPDVDKIGYIWFVRDSGTTGTTSEICLGTRKYGDLSDDKFNELLNKILNNEFVVAKAFNKIKNVIGTDNYLNLPSGLTYENLVEGIEQVSGDVQTLEITVEGKADSATTLGGYGITDAYTKSEVDTALSGKANSAHTHTIANVDGLQTALNNIDTTIINNELVSSIAFNTIKESVGLTDGLKLPSGLTYENIIGGIEQVSGSVINNEFIIATGFNKLKATIGTDNYLNLPSGLTYENLVEGIEQVSGNIQTIETTVESKADSATTLDGYGITDAYTKSEVDTALSGKANSAHTHIIANVDGLQTALDDKANNAITLAGYNITDAYTKDEIESAHTAIAQSIISLNDNKEDISNKVTEINSGCTNEQYASAKAVYDVIGNIQQLLSQI